MRELSKAFKPVTGCSPVGIHSSNKKVSQISAVLLCIFLLTACANSTSGNFAAVEKGSGGSIPPMPSYVIVQKGENIGMLSRRYGVTKEALADANGLSNTDNLKVGQRLTLPVGDGRTYVAIAGDSVRSVSGMLHLPPDDLARENNISTNGFFQPGQIVYLPGAKETSNASTAEAQTWQNPVPVVTHAVPLPEKTTQLTETADDTIWLPSPNVNMTKENSAIPEAPQATEQHNTAPAVKQLEVTKIEKSQAKPATKSSFLWPVNGEVVSGFGSKSAGQHSDGIDIAAKSETPVKAAKDGVVASVKKGMGGLGTVVLVQHKDGFITVYARLKDVTVKKGQSVKSGQTLAHLDSQSNKTPKLHFQIRKDRKPVDPMKYLDRA